MDHEMEKKLVNDALYAAIKEHWQQGEVIFGHSCESPWFDPKPAPIGRVEVEPAKPSSRVIFRKVYKAAGYPTDPRNDAARMLEASMNLIAQPRGTVDYRPLRAWLGESIN